MNRGIELIIARMQSNPEEFKPTEGMFNKWESLVSSWRGILDEEDVKAFNEALKETRKEIFVQIVMQELLNPTPHTDYLATGYQHPYNTAMTSAQSAFRANSINVGSQTLDEETIKHMREHLKHMKQMGKI